MEGALELEKSYFPPIIVKISSGRKSSTDAKTKGEIVMSIRIFALFLKCLSTDCLLVARENTVIVKWET